MNIAASAGLDLARYGFGAPSAGGCGGTALELFYEGVPGVLARYPNVAPDGTPQWINVGGVVNKDLAFTTRDTRVLAWANESQAWLHGYWGFDCACGGGVTRAALFPLYAPPTPPPPPSGADSYVEVASIVPDVGGARVTVNASTPPMYGFKTNARFCGVNLRSPHWGLGHAPT